jgi:hypothetical protein
MRGSPRHGAFSAPARSNNREAASISGIAGPHLGADRPAVTIDENDQDNLPQIRTVIFGITMLAKCLTARAFKIVETDCIKEYQIERGKQIPTSLKQTLFNNTFRQRGAKDVRPLCSLAGNSSPSQAIVRYR